MVSCKHCTRALFTLEEYRTEECWMCLIILSTSMRMSRLYRPVVIDGILPAYEGIDEMMFTEPQYL